MSSSRTNRLLVTAAVAVGLLAGAAGIVGAVAGDDSSGDDRGQGSRASVRVPDVLDDDRSSDDDGDDGAPLPAETPVDAARAREVATAEAPGTVRELELDTEEGRAVWEVEVVADDGTEATIHVDAETGEVTRHEVDDD